MLSKIDHELSVQAFYEMFQREIPYAKGYVFRYWALSLERILSFIAPDEDLIERLWPEIDFHIRGMFEGVAVDEAEFRDLLNASRIGSAEDALIRLTHLTTTNPVFALAEGAKRVLVGWLSSGVEGCIEETKPS